MAAMEVLYVVRCALLRKAAESRCVCECRLNCRVKVLAKVHSSFNSPSFDAFIIAFDVCVTLSTRNRLSGRVLRSLQEER
ncbi:hypothetical protein KC19_9G171600 [Ceratodon purpureus]|uniref:Uncharacterized protein n=1 Tax=Ceratodon purpureus TaxID=3225 RepID=A0A8T0H0Z9_CERPU|nr:hypothetical protein KC19_9G171600 [Ceratodon purpureus]